MSSKIVISIEFIEDLIELPKNIQEKTIDFLYKFDKNPHSPGINLEKINIVNDKQLYSVRIDLNYRGIVYKDEQNKLFHLLWVEHHHEVYGNIDQKNDIKIGNLPVYNKDHYVKLGIIKNKSNNLFSSVSRKELLSLGVEERYLTLVRSLPDIAALQQIKEIFPNFVYSNLELKAYEFHVNEIKEENNRQKKYLINIFKEEILLPALAPDSGLEQKIRESVKHTMEMIENKKSIHDIINFYEDALELKSGKYIHDKLKEKKLQTFEDIEPKIRDFICKIN